MQEKKVYVLDKELPRRAQRTTKPVMRLDEFVKTLLNPNFFPSFLFPGNPSLASVC